MTKFADIEKLAKNGDKDAFEKMLIFQFVFSQLLLGHIEIQGKTDEEILEKIIEFFIEGVTSNSLTISVATDHTDDILEIARELCSQGRDEVALLCNATWLEHKINEIISIVYIKRGEGDNVDDKIRKLFLKDKLKCLYVDLGLPKLDENLYNAIIKITEARNNFVHYKWNFIDVDNDLEKKEIKDVLVLADDVVAKLQNYFLENLKIGEARRLALRYCNIEE